MKKTDIKNWHPVSLLCSNYELLTNVLANRTAEVLSQIIHPVQTYCVLLRTISLVQDIIDTSKMFSNFGLISIDQEKAFDRVEYHYL